MSFKRITMVDIYETFRRWHAGQSIKHINNSLGYARKTIRKHIQLAQKSGFDREASLPTREEFMAKLESHIKPRASRKASAQEVFLPFLDEFRQFINDPVNPLKPKIAFELFLEKYEIDGKVSYSSFKRFVHANNLAGKKDSSTCRLESEPAHYVQIDYAYMGLLFDLATKRKRKVYAFIATLPFSRHKFVQFVHSMDKDSFISSHLAMFEFFEGVMQILKIDNLKSGVLKADIYDPVRNKAYAEMAEYYHCFIEPCRVNHPKDKPTVERDVQTIRDQFRKFLALYPDLDLPKANKNILFWLKNTYAQREHGTTHHKPWDDFVQFEKPLLLPLPPEPFQLPEWKKAKVHPDHYVQFNKKAFSVPHDYVGEYVWLRGCNNILQIFHDEKMIKQHIIMNRFRHTDMTDFPENIQAALDEGLPLKIQTLALDICPDLQTLIRHILSPNCFLNLRKAQAVLKLAQKNANPQQIEQVCRYFLQNQLNATYKAFKQQLKNLENQSSSDEPLPVSESSKGFVRDLTYFTKTN